MIERKQFSTEILIAFSKRLAQFQVNLSEAYQTGILMIIKQMVVKYAAVRSAILEIDDD